MATEYTCTERFMNNRREIGVYALKDGNGNVVRISASELKRLISNGKILVTNLKLTSDNRLIMADNDGRHSNNTMPVKAEKDTSDNKEATDKKDTAVEPVQAYFTTKCGKYITKISEDHKITFNEYTGNIVNLVRKARLLGKEAYTFDGNLAIISNSDEIRVYGHNTMMQSDCTNMFNGLRAKSLDFNNTNWCNTMTITRMFAHSRIGTLTFDGAKKCCPNTAAEAFFDAHIGSVSFQGFSSEKLLDAAAMFREFRTTELDLKTFKARQLSNAYEMFRRCIIVTKATIGLTGENILDARCMFRSAIMQELDITGFKPEELSIDFEAMFEGFKGLIRTDNEQIRASIDLRGHIIK